MGTDLGSPDEFMGDGLSMDLMAGSLGGRFPRSELGLGANGLAQAGAYRTAYDANFPDRTMFIIIVSVLGAVALLLIAALVALFVYSRKNNAKKYYVEA